MKKFKFKLNIDLTTLKARRFSMAAFYFTAGVDMCNTMLAFKKGSLVLAALCAVLMILFIRWGNKERAEIEKMIELDSYLEGYKHGLKSGGMIR